MTMSDPLPLTGSDLREIATAVDEVEATQLAGSTILGRIEVYRPGRGPGDFVEVIGWVQRFDLDDPELGWGFMPEFLE